MTIRENAAIIAEFVADLRGTELPPEVVIIAKQSLIDWFAVCIAAVQDGEARLAADTIHAWKSSGNAVSVDGRSGSAAPIALINGTYSHALDYDDFHIASVHHAGGPTFAAALAVAMDHGCSGQDALKAFVSAFEVSTQIGMNDVGLSLGNAGWHPTCILGHISSTIACATLLKLDCQQIENALGFAAAQAGGLMSSAGTIAKPFLVGKSAMAGVISAELTVRGLRAPRHLLEGASGLFATLFQKNVAPELHRLGREWQMLQNTFKPYSACQLTHASIDVARTLSSQFEAAAVSSVKAYVNPFALKIAGHEQPSSPLQARFSLKHCIAMALLGHGASPADFTDESVKDSQIARLRDLIEIVPTEGVSRTSARLEVVANGKQNAATTSAALGSLGRPMSMVATEDKFLESVVNELGSRSKTMLDALKSFEQRGAIEEVAKLLRSIQGQAHPSPAAV